MTGYHIHFFNASGVEDSDYDYVFKTRGYDKYENLSSQIIDGRVVYKIDAEVADNVIEPRYECHIQDHNSKIVVEVMTPDPHESVKIISTLKFH